MKADDSITIPTPGDGAFITSCGIEVFTVPPSTYFKSIEDMIDSYEEINLANCGTRKGWHIWWNNNLYDDASLRLVCEQSDLFA